MNLLTSATLVISVVLVSAPALAERPDFSKTRAAQSDYRFSDNQPAQYNFQMQRTTRHDFSKTTAANSQYNFSDNDAVSSGETRLDSSQHDFSKTDAARGAS
ncbi:hypothetical protein LZP69_11825 [Shewanella sp. AS1]|uniref:hypothetical protein n=1 Tax=Shewanella sp. AS1 TaxID=2907626 RepID=UPI001F3E9DFB|nr:hypothetical protein [Shewanella sp. AS1]MCE9679851.1 hypothetical protein [Shewanella sp. AS1]